jgi:hypothetical protein
VYAALAEEGARAEEIALTAGVARRTVFKHLKALAEMGLAINESGLWSLGGTDLDQVAEEMGATGRGELRAARVEMDRAAHTVVGRKIQFKSDQAAYGTGVAIANWKKADKIPSYVDPITGEDLRS